MTTASAPKGDKIHIANGKLTVPDHPVIPFIEGDGTGRDIWRASVRVFDAAVAKAYGGKRTFFASFGNSFWRNASTFCASGEPDAHSMPA